MPVLLKINVHTWTKVIYTDNVMLALIYPILDVFQDQMHYTKDFTNCID